MWMLIPMVGVPILLMGLFPLPVMVYAVLFQNVVRGMYDPFIDSFTEKFLRNETRATVLSMQSSIVSVFISMGLLVFGIVIKEFELIKSLIFLGIITLLGFSILMCLRSRLFDMQKVSNRPES